MTKIITVITLFVCSLLSAQTQFEQGMTKAFGLWKEGKNTEASALFERIASAEKNSYLPNYYVALVNTTTAFTTKDKDQINALLTKAQTALDVEITFPCQQRFLPVPLTQLISLDRWMLPVF